MENLKILTAKEVCEKVDAAINGDDNIATLLGNLTAANNRYNEVRFLDMELTEEEVKAGVTQATLLTSVDDACEKLNHEIKKVVYAALYEIRQDALPALLLGTYPQYAHKDTTKKDDNGSTTTHAVAKKPAHISIKNYDNWANKEHKAHVVADTSYFNRVDTLAYFMLESVAAQMNIDSLKNYKFANGFTKDITRGNIVGPKASKTSIAKEVQKCLDALLFVPRADGKNTYKAISKDVTFLQNVVCSAGKDRGTLQAMKSGKFLAQVEDVMYCVITERAYAITYTVEKQKA